MLIERFSYCLQEDLPDMSNLGCILSTTIARGSGCGKGILAGDVCWVLTVSTVAMLSDRMYSDQAETSCKGSQTKELCARSGISIVVFESVNSAGNSSCGASPELPLSSTDSGDLTEAFTDTSGATCGGNFLKPEPTGWPAEQGGEGQPS